MKAPLTDARLRAAWHRLRMKGDYEASMRNRAVRCAVEAAGRALEASEQKRARRLRENRAAGERHE
ncbi:hypothetical protein [Paraburkholderia sp. SIMBA_030]|uniref:hypothetical protein n=1 Tax=Paraburkholderia sp. SIMBA_030 TaxID=3085773 RepID=UPI003979EF27